MKELKGACIIGQSGGPTSVINASAYGVIDTALKSPCITQVLGAEHGIKGVLNDRLFDMGLEDPEELRLLKYTPSSALGSCRYKIADPEKDDTDYRRILEVFKKHNVRYFFYNGGNDSMDTCNKINTYMQSVGYECRVMGVPKTIDNDLFGTDHCPGYASAAKYIATSMMEVYHDAHVYDTGMIVVMEIMGRHAGWLAASAALASEYGAGPDLIYLPETDFSMPKFIEDVKRVYAEKGSCIIAVSEGIHYEDGGFVSEAKVAANDGFGHAQLGGLAAILAQVLKEETGAKVRALIAAACDGRPRSYNIRFTYTGTGRSPPGVVGHAAAHDIDYPVIIGTAYRDDFAADARRGDGSPLWSHVPSCHNHYKACIPDFFDTAHQGRCLTHVPAGERADGHIDDTDVESVALLQDEVETGQDIGNIAAAPFVQHLDRNEVAAGSDAAEPAFAGTAVPGDDAADIIILDLATSDVAAVAVVYFVIQTRSAFFCVAASALHFQQIYHLFGILLALLDGTEIIIAASFHCNLTPMICFDARIYF